ncbi:MAG: antitoxin [Actinobacteria bacterium]|nr:antitoxin [Actinomycetota bacterium]
MLSFRVATEDAEAATGWAGRLGIDRSQLLRDALRHHLVRLAGERDVDAWLIRPLDERERALADVADWGPAEDWSEWANRSDPPDGSGAPGSPDAAR